ncbi:PREDICTED: heavy metal-associated isoprenylated plant protein 3 [Tarenaya hassleriana]|uniref:heavy metal-associated isoprenylated plant protein 3 n=1 Tax=Tarenaya hassleriana TaxID=28532 RepID=UPI00053C2AD1|nr:PREDICTED: heavy metal-associated isoprenylated plant protein 3 [Tarenaya hassleriana]
MAAKEEKKEQLITAVYKVNLHCRKCACDIKKPLLRTEGVHSVDFDLEKNEVKVKGIMEVMKIHKQLEKWSKKKVDLVSPKPEVKKIIEKKTVEVKKEVFHTTVVKVHIHCGKCEKDLRQKLLKHKGIHTVKTDTKAQTLTVHGTIESTKLLTYIRKKIHKHAEIVTTKTEEEEEKKKKEEVVKVVEVKKTKEVEEFKEKVKVEAKDRDGNTPYFVHYVYAPQLFSDENPNACCVI